MSYLNKTFSGNAPDREKPEDLYPKVIEQANGRKVYVVQAYAFTKYLGNLSVEFDKNGEVKNCIGNPILLDNTIQQGNISYICVWQSEGASSSKHSAQSKHNSVYDKLDQ